jgi:hypothetical protein
VLPFVVAVRGGVAGGADAGVVDQDVERAEPVDDRADRRVDGVTVADVADDGEIAVRTVLIGQIETGDPGATAAQHCHGRRADAAGAAGDHRGEPCEVGHGVRS